MRETRGGRDYSSGVNGWASYGVSYVGWLKRSRLRFPGNAKSPRDFVALVSDNRVGPRASQGRLFVRPSTLLYRSPTMYASYLSPLSAVNSGRTAHSESFTPVVTNVSGKARRT